MRVIAAALLAGLALAALALWSSGVFQALGFWLADQQHALQSTLAAHIRALRAGEPAAFWSLVALCGGYGFLHALGPGHGKALIAGAAVGTRATALRMAAIAVIGSLAQAAVAILAVYGGFAAFEATARGTVAAADHWVAPVGNLAVAAIGGWILWRGIGALPARAGDPGHEGCGHAHGPGAEEAAGATGIGATLALVGAMAARPCTGAIVVLVIAWRMGLAAQGAAGVVAMGLGTAAFTVLVALLAVTSRDAAFLTAGDGRAARLLAPGLQILAGGLILGISGTLLVGALAS
jgi:ABC-type nickel/cobalt efflux system permease component RcnA